MLYLVATPIGNLGDITYRAVETLKGCDLILCEDTRHSRKLTNHYGITTPLKSYHKFSEAKQAASIIAQLKNGLAIALISDAGTPGISDPGARLVKECLQEGVKVTAIPGPCAAIMALTLSGLETDRFQFVGFLPKKKGELEKNLLEYCAYKGTTICYESPHRLKNILKTLTKIAPEQQLTIARELTKTYEEIKTGNAEELLLHWQEKEVKGEIVLLIAQNHNVQHSFDSLTIEEHFHEMQLLLPKNEAIKRVAELRKIPKRQVYNLIHKKNDHLQE